ncbi:hypothetical protein H5410_061845 [Solanum commersonii]|uniref:Uncharacterized protein n=1 Tax=Solanum commersonii TaxID=4109 RepID=A0A9J5W9T7_SOLCO|nr:hypothetical protein H5410_061845 [Solanum commersonii]
MHPTQIYAIMEPEKSYLINLKDLEDKADEILDELTKEIDGRPVVATDHNMNETIRSRQPHEGVEMSSWTNNTNKRLNILDAKVNKLSDIVSDLRVVVEESRINDKVGDGQQDMLAKKKMVDHPSIIDPSSLEIYFIKMRQSYKNQKNVLAAWKFLKESDSNIQIARFILLFELQKEQILTSVDTLGIKTGVISSSPDHGICTSAADVDKTVVAASSQDTSSPLDNRTCDSQEDACKYASPTGVSVAPFSLDRDICASLMDVHRTVVVASSQGVVSSSLDHGICASLANANKTDVVTSSQNTSSPLDDRTYNSQVDPFKDAYW